MQIETSFNVLLFGYLAFEEFSNSFGKFFKGVCANSVLRKFQYWA